MRGGGMTVCIYDGTVHYYLLVYVENIGSLWL